MKINGLLKYVVRSKRPSSSWAVHAFKVMRLIQGGKLVMVACCYSLDRSPGIALTNRPVTCKHCLRKLGRLPKEEVKQ